MNRSTTSAGIAAACVAALTWACDAGTSKQVDLGTGGKPSTLTGCLTRGDSGRSIILRSENTPQPQGNERPERPASAPNVYRVESDQADHVGVEDHVGSRVTVTGFLQAVPVHASGDANGTLQPAATSGANTAPQDQRSDMIDMGVVRVTGIQPLGPCAS
jgi:hypothetical protein